MKTCNLFQYRLNVFNPVSQADKRVDRTVEFSQFARINAVMLLTYLLSDDIKDLGPNGIRSELEKPEATDQHQA